MDFLRLNEGKELIAEPIKERASIADSESKETSKLSTSNSSWPLSFKGL